MEQMKWPEGWSDLIIVRLLRRYVAAPEAKEKPLPYLTLCDERRRRQHHRAAARADQHAHFFLGAAQSLFVMAFLLRPKPGLGGALALAVLFTVQVALAFGFRADEAPMVALIERFDDWGHRSADHAAEGESVRR